MQQELLKKIIDTEKQVAEMVEQEKTRTIHVLYAVQKEVQQEKERACQHAIQESQQIIEEAKARAEKEYTAVQLKTREEIQQLREKARTNRDSAIQAILKRIQKTWQ